jgi:hypothetical protein
MPAMKKWTAILLCLLLAASLAACAAKTEKTSGGDQIANPFVSCETMQDAAKLAGFEMTAPETVDGYPDRAISAIEKDMIQVDFTGGDNRLTLRKAAGSDDVSGDYNTYAETNAVTVGELSVTMKGNDGQVSVATWTDGGYSYAIDASGAALSADQAAALVQQIG